MDTKLLHEFVVLAERLSFSTTARLLNMSQSSLSRHIIQLEKYYDTQLFFRGDKMTLTYAGQVLLEELTDLFAVEERIKQKIKEAKSHYQGTISIEDYEFSQEVRNFFLLSINQFRKDNPDVLFEFRRVKQNLTIADSIAEGYFDVGLLVNSGSKDSDIEKPEGLQVIPLRHLASRIMVYAHNSLLPENESDAVSITHFSDALFLLPLKPEYASFRRNLTDICESNGFTPKFLMKEIHTYEQLAMFDMDGSVQIVREGDVNEVSSPFMMNPNCGIRSLREEYYAVPYLLVKEDAQSEVVCAFANYLKELATKLSL